MGGLHAKSMTSQRYRANTRWRICVTMATLWKQQDGGYMLFYIFNSTVVDWTCFFGLQKETNRLENKEDQLVDRENIPSIYTKEITHLQSGNQTDMELRNKSVGLCQQVQQWHHAEIAIQNSQNHNKYTRYVTNHIVHTDFNIPYVSDVIHERINKHHHKL